MNVRNTNEISTLTRETLIRGTEKFARVLAVEGLVIEHHSDLDTAEFDTETRVIRLPILEGMTPAVYEGYLSHEVGHALHSPHGEKMQELVADIERKGVPFYYFNVTEDARIEKLLKRRYPGMVRSFGQHYKELNENLGVFTHPNGIPVEEWDLVDRINYRMKLGETVDVPFTPEERVFVDRLMNDCETVADAMQIAEDLAAFVRSRQDASKEGKDSSNGDRGTSNRQKGKESRGNKAAGRKHNTGHKARGEGEIEQGENGEGDAEDQADAQGAGSQGDQNDDSGSDDGKSGADGKDQDDQNGDSDSDDGGSESDDADDGSDHDDFEPNAQISKTAGWTDGNLSKFLKKSASSNGYRAGGNFSDIQNGILPKNWKYQDYIYELSKKELHVIYDDEIQRLKNFSSEIKPLVSLMAQVFNQKASANNFARQGIAKTGTLDLRLLQKYKFTEDLFKKVVVAPKQKNHGFVVVIDWSSSMLSVTESVILQTLILVRFWQAIGVPFEIFLFTNSGRLGSIRKRPDPTTPMAIEDLRPNSNFGMLHIASSTWKKDRIDQALAWASVTGREFQHYTPLEEAIFLSRYILDDFIASNTLDKAALVLITDGAGNSYVKDGRPANFRPAESFIFDRKTGINTYAPAIVGRRQDGRRFLVALKNIFGDRLSIIGFFISDASRELIVRQSEEMLAVKRQDIIFDYENGCAYTTKGIGYDKYFIIPPSALKPSVGVKKDMKASKDRLGVVNDSDARVRAIVAASKLRPAQRLSRMAKEFVVSTA